MKLLLALLLSGCTIGRLDNDRLRVIPLSAIHDMDDAGFPAELFRTHPTKKPEP